MQELFVPSLIEISQMFHFKRFFPIYTCKNSFPYCAPLRPLGTIICTSVNSHYVRKLSCKSELFWFSGSRGENFFQWPHQFFAFLWLSTLWRGPGPWFEQFWIPFTQGWFVSSLTEIGLLVLDKKIFFQYIKHMLIWEANITLWRQDVV
jgi:hypothetical protein